MFAWSWESPRRGGNAPDRAAWRVPRRQRRVDDRRRAVHERGRQHVRLVPLPHGRRPHESLGPHLPPVRPGRFSAQDARRSRRRLADHLRRAQAVLRRHRSSDRHLRHERRLPERARRHLSAAAGAAMLRIADQAGRDAAQHPVRAVADVDPDQAARRSSRLSLLRRVRARMRPALELLLAVGAAAAGDEDRTPHAAHERDGARGHGRRSRPGHRRALHRPAHRPARITCRRASSCWRPAPARRRAFFSIRSPRSFRRGSATRAARSAAI